MNLVVVDTGAGNLFTLEHALRHVGGAPAVTADPEAIRRADRLVLPGQGAFRDCMAGLAAGGADAVREVIASGRPYLGICLGLQILFDESEEHAGCSGLGVLAGRVVRLQAPKVPHMGWNDVSIRRDDPLLRGIPDGTHFYFVHSYHATPRDPSAIALACDYAGPVCAAVRRDNVFATQFHPERSGAAGLRLLANFLGSAS